MIKIKSVSLFENVLAFLELGLSRFSYTMSVSPVECSAKWQELIGQDTSVHQSFQISFCYLDTYCQPAGEKKNISSFHLVGSFGWVSSCSLFKLHLLKKKQKKNCGVCHPDRHWAVKANASHYVFFFLSFLCSQTNACPRKWHWNKLM